MPPASCHAGASVAIPPPGAVPVAIDEIPFHLRPPAAVPPASCHAGASVAIPPPGGAVPLAVGPASGSASDEAMAVAASGGDDDEAARECPVNFEELTMDNLVTTSCGHRVSRSGLAQWEKRKPRECPACREPMTFYVFASDGKRVTW